MIQEFPKISTSLFPKSDFPNLLTAVNGQALAYLDSAASAQKPHAATEATTAFVEHQYANVHRGVHTLSQLATDAYELVRDQVKVILNAADRNEIIFTKGCTESINLVAQSFARPLLQPGDEILLTELEHHSNIVPWQLAAQASGAKVIAARIHDNGELDIDDFKAKLNSRTKIVAFTHISNALGTILPAKEMTEMAHAVGATVLIDGAQSGPHAAIDVQEIGADFYVLSIHKMYGPTGVGVLYGKLNLLEAMPPYQGGGSMIRSVSFEETTFAELPAKFEAGTPNIAGVVGLGATLDYIAGPNWNRDSWVRRVTEIGNYEAVVREYGVSQLAEIEGLSVYGDAEEMAGIISFTLKNVHPHDLGTILDQHGVAVRAGHHCCQPLMKRLGVPATARASIAAYNDLEDMDRLASAVIAAKEIFA
ncbi:csdA Selenocysteine lyase/Cysteine desulfurase [Fimbriimonadaceae bacterium]